MFWCPEVLVDMVVGRRPVAILVHEMEAAELSVDGRLRPVFHNMKTYQFLHFWLLGIESVSKVCSQYLKDTNMLFFGGLLVAIAIEKWNLHKRIALRVLLIVGVKPAFLMLGFMVVTAFLSMWISNTATTAMMIPIAQAVLDELHSSEEKLEELNISNINSSKDESDGICLEHAFKMNALNSADLVSINQEKETKFLTDAGTFVAELDGGEFNGNKQPDRLEKHLKLCKGMSLCVCYAASIGGIATLTGTPPNLVMKGQLDELFPENGNVINFASWFGFAFPTTFVVLTLSWIWLQVMFIGTSFKDNFGCGGTPAQKERDKKAYEVICLEYKKLGSMSFAEICVLILFILLILLWFTMDPGFMPGWATISFNKDGKSYVTDSTVAMFISLAMFFFPSEIPSFKYQNSEPSGKTAKIHVPPPLLDWPTVNRKMPWSIIILLGGGFALAKGSEESRLSLWIGEQLTPLQNIPPAAIAFILCLLVAIFTECTSNVATTTLFLPILASMAKTTQLNPLYIMIPCTMASSLAFMLPVATPPNAIAFSYGQLKVIDMAKAGFFLNIFGVLTINLAINSWGYSMFNLGTFPSWANSTGKP